MGMEIVRHLKKNVENYLAVLLAFGILALNTLGVADESLLPKVTLAVLCLLALSILRAPAAQTWAGRYPAGFKPENLADAGLRRIHPSAPVTEISRKCSLARNEVRFLHTWLPSSAPLPDGLLELINRTDVPVKILLLHPDSTAASLRLKALGLKADAPTLDLALENLRAVLEREKVTSDQLYVRVHTGLPPFGLYMADDWFAVGFYWHGRSGVEGPYLECEGRRGELGRRVVETFDRLWDDARPALVFRNGMWSQYPDLVSQAEPRNGRKESL